MVTRKKEGALTAHEKTIVKALLNKGCRNQDIQALINLGRPATINSARITEVKKNKRQKAASDDEVAFYEIKKRSIDTSTGLNLFDDERLIRAREAMILAVQLFNSAAFRFKTEVFSVLVNIAWTYLMHEFYKRKKVKIVQKNGRSLLLRVRPETLCRITEFSEHESNGRELDEGERVAVEVLPVLGQSAAAVEPGDGAFDHPTPGLDDEALHPIGSLDDLGLEIGQDAGQGAVKDRPLIGAVGEQFPEKGKQTEQGRQPRETAVAILNVGGGDDAVQQQALRIDQNRPLLALDQLAGIEAVAVDASPPFSALFTL